jgi:hypothetical protein
MSLSSASQTGDVSLFVKCECTALLAGAMCRVLLRSRGAHKRGCQCSGSTNVQQTWVGAHVRLLEVLLLLMLLLCIMQ